MNFAVTKDSILESFNQLMQDEEEEVDNLKKKIEIRQKEKVCGLEKKEVFIKAIMPVIKTLVMLSGKEMKDLLREIATLMEGSKNPGYLQ